MSGFGAFLKPILSAIDQAVLGLQRAVGDRRPKPCPIPIPVESRRRSR
jgi:hypothetical protein